MLSRSLLFCAAEASATITVISISVPEEISPGERFDVTYTLSGTSTLAVAELRFYVGNSPAGPIANPNGTFSLPNESFQLPLVGTFPTFRPPIGPQTRSIVMPSLLQSFGCFPSGTWYFILVVDSMSLNADSFSVAPLSISSFTPASGPPCTPVTLSGNKFFDASNVFFDDTPAGGSIINDTTIETAVPPGATTGRIRLVNSCGANPDALSLSTFFVTPIVNPTMLSSFTPTASIGAFVRIEGENFTDSTAVVFSGIPAARAVIDPQTIDALVPAGASDGPIAVGTDCQGIDVSATNFIVDPYCASYADFLDASRIDSVRMGNLEYVNSETPGCARYTNNSNLVKHVFPGQTGLPIEIRQGACNGFNFFKVTKLFADWNSDDDFADVGEQVLVGPAAGNDLLSGTFDIPPSALLGPTRMRVVTAATTEPNDVAACGVYVVGETQDYTLEISPCAGARDLPPDLWHMISLSCDPGTSNSVQDLFADDLTGTYGVDWGLFEYDAVIGQSSLMSLGDTVQTGQGYWLKTLNSGQSIGLGGVNPLAIGIHGLPNSVMDTALVADPVVGRPNLVGFPFTTNVDWADVQVIDGGSVLTLAQADPVIGADRACDLTPPHPSCIMSRVFYRWNGSAYDSFNGVTPGAEGVLSPLDGLWVKAFKSGIALRIPEAPPSRSKQPTSSSEDLDGWFIRLIAASGDLRDDGNVLGELVRTVEGYDLHDLEELPPVGNPYLTIVFPHPDWQDRAGDYTTDFRSLHLAANSRPNRWRFEVRASDPTAEVTLSWHGPKARLLESELIDEETGERVEIRPAGSFSFTMTGASRSFEWSVKKEMPSQTAPTTTSASEPHTANARSDTGVEQTVGNSTQRLKFEPTLEVPLGDAIDH